MAFSLGIHVGHHSSCAIVHDGVLVAAIQQERVTRRKHDGRDCLSDELPISQCLAAAGIELADVDHIVSSFQAVAPGGFGLHQPLVAPGFVAFDPSDPRHIVISHHLAHAYCAFGTSGFAEAAIVVCDLGGTSSEDGQDFSLPFDEWVTSLTRMNEARPVRTESLSIYHGNRRGVRLCEREYGVAHSAPGSFVQSVASLYENVAHRVFRREEAHGRLMALAAHGKPWGAVAPSDIVLVVDDRVSFRNDWQHTVAWGGGALDNADLAAAVQEATETVLLAYARRAHRAAPEVRRLAVAGGVFLNILANTRLAESGLFDEVFVPSAPHDAGISVGCAFYGDWRRAAPGSVTRSRRSSDRLGQRFPADALARAIASRAAFVDVAEYTPHGVAAALRDGAIVARSTGRSEFGPRALGSRSLLGSPLLESTKRRLNEIKQRETWRPVAPIVPSERCGTFFAGPESPYMSFAHVIHAAHAQALLALSHPDGTTRAQTLERDDDPGLYELLLVFGELSGYPILVNTSLNGTDEPIIETPDEALDFFLRMDDVDALVTETLVIRRRAPWQDDHLYDKAALVLAPDWIVSLGLTASAAEYVAATGVRRIAISPEIFAVLGSLRPDRSVQDVLASCGSASSEIAWELWGLLRRGVVAMTPSR